MALLGTIDKQPREIIDFDISYTDFLAGRVDTLTIVTTEVVPPGELTVSSATINVDKVKCVVTGGLTGITYKVTVLTQTNAGLKLEDEIMLFVEEV